MNKVMGEWLVERIRRGFYGQGFMHTLGAELSRVAPGECVIQLQYNEGLTQQHGLFHGGVTSTLADNAAGFACYTLMEDSEQPLTIEFKISFLEAGNGQLLEARAKVLRAGRRIKHAQTDVFAIDDSGEKLIAVALVTIATTKSVQEIRKL